MGIKSQCRTDCLGSDLSGCSIQPSYLTPFLSFLSWLMTVATSWLGGSTSSNTAHREKELCVFVWVCVRAWAVIFVAQ